MFSDFYKDKTVLVTGNTGFKGSWLTVWLLELGAKVVGLSRDVPTTPSMFELLGLKSRIDHHFTDVTDLAAVRQVLRKTQPDVVFHLAAQPIVTRSYEDPLETLKTNVIGTANILEGLRRSERACVAVMITSDKCYENVEWTWGYRENDRLGGKDPYSASKAAAELVIHTFYHSFFKRPDSPLRVVSTRAGNVVGGGDWADNRIIPDTVRAWSVDQPVVIRNPTSTRPWQHVLDPLSGYLLLGKRLSRGADLNGESYNFGPSAEQVFTVSEFLDTMSASWPFKKQHEKFVAHVGTTIPEAGLLKLNCDKAQTQLGWKPALLFSEAAAMTADWYYAYYQNGIGGMYDLTLSQLWAYSEKAQVRGLKWCG